MLQPSKKKNRDAVVDGSVLAPVADEREWAPGDATRRGDGSSGDGVLVTPPVSKEAMLSDVCQKWCTRSWPGLFLKVKRRGPGTGGARPGLLVLLRARVADSALSRS